MTFSGAVVNVLISRIKVLCLKQTTMQVCSDFFFQIYVGNSNDQNQMFVHHLKSIVSILKQIIRFQFNNYASRIFVLCLIYIKMFSILCHSVLDLTSLTSTTGLRITYFLMVV